MIQMPLSPTIALPTPCSDSLQRLIDRIQGTRNLTPKRMKDYLLEAHLSAEDLMPWSDFSHPVTDSYGRKLAFQGEHFEVMVMSWLPGDFSAIHDHGSAEWGAVQCFGAAEHYVYRFSGGILSTLEPAPYTPGMVRAVDPSLIHQMGNGGDIPFLSLHVYGYNRNYEPLPSSTDTLSQTRTTAKTITGNARIFDLLEGNIQYTDGGVFFCLPEHQINQRSTGLRGDRETTLRHHRLMSNRISRILMTGHDRTLRQALAQKQILLQTQIQHLITQEQ